MNVGEMSVRLVIDNSEAKTRRIQELLARVEELESAVSQAVTLLELARNPGNNRRGRCTGKIDCVCWACQVDDYIAQNSEPYNPQEDGR